MLKTIISAILVALTAGCASVTPTPETMNGVKTIEIRDATDPLILHGTEAKMIAEFIHVAIKAKGYETCTAPCQADATATVNVTEFSRKVNFNPMARVVTPQNVVIFTFQMHDKNRVLLMSRKMKYREAVAQRDLAVKSVQEVAERIPAAK